MEDQTEKGPGVTGEIAKSTAAMGAAGWKTLWTLLQNSRSVMVQGRLWWP